MSLFWSCRSALRSSRRGDSHTRVGRRSNLATEAEGTESVAVRVVMGDKECLCLSRTCANDRSAKCKPEEDRHPGLQFGKVEQGGTGRGLSYSDHRRNGRYCLRWQLSMTIDVSK